MSVAPILEKALDGERITDDEALVLLGSRDLVSIGRVANELRNRKADPTRITFNIDRNINYTNVCSAVCDFCAFYRSPGDADAYVLPKTVIYQKIEETIALGGDQLLMQGGNHPTSRWSGTRSSSDRSRRATRSTCTPSPPEIWHFHKLNKLPLADVLTAEGRRPRQHPGRRRRDPRRSRPQGDHVEQGADRRVAGRHRVWHQLGGRSTCTMMFGHVETLAERIEHLRRVRQLQDETGGFTAFICWTFQPRQPAGRQRRPRAPRRSSTCGRRRSPGCTSTTSRTSSRRG